LVKNAKQSASANVLGIKMGRVLEANFTSSGIIKLIIANPERPQD
jgi:hypothetical protein